MNDPNRYLNWQCLQMNRNQLPHPISHSEINQSLTEIHLGGNIIGAEGAKYVAEALKVNTSLTEIHLGGNIIGAEGAKYVAEALKVNTSLTKIHFYAHRPLVFLK